MRKKKGSYENVSNSDFFKSRLSCLNQEFESIRNFVCGVELSVKFTKQMLDAPEQSLSAILDAAARIKRREDQIRRPTRGLCARASNCADGDGGILQHLF